MIMINKSILKLILSSIIIGLLFFSCDKNNNSNPECEITSPVEGNIFVPGEDVFISIEASDKEGEIKELRLYINEGLVYTFTGPPYEITWNNTFEAGLGNYTIEAIAVDEAEAETSHEITISLEQGLIYENEIYDLGFGFLQYWGVVSDNVYNFDILLFSNSFSSSDVGNGIYFELFCASATDIVDGEYQFNRSSLAPFTFDYSDFILDYNVTTEIGISGLVSAGSTYIEKTGSTYKIFMNCTSSEGKSIIGYYEGALQYSDESGGIKSDFQSRLKSLPIKY